MKTYPTTDMKLAVILATLGVPLRESDPVTCVVSDDPLKGQQKTYTFWFDHTEGEHDEKLKELLRAHNECRSSVTDCQLDEEHPFFYIRAALDNRDCLMRWVRHDVAPMRVLQHGERTLLIGDKASARTKQLAHKMLLGDLTPLPKS